MPPIMASPRLRAELPGQARGRAIVIDYFASARCGLVIGDITARFGPDPRPETYVRLSDLEGVPVLAERRLVPLLDESALTLDLSRLPFGSRLRVRLDRPERWLEFLDRPGIARRGWRRD